MSDKYIRSKRAIIITMCTLICIMAVGYAAFATQLTINGTANIESTWNVEFTNITQVSKTSGVTITSAPTASGTTATFNVDLTSPGDKVVYRITVTNNGTLNAIIDKITASETGSDAIKFEITGVKKGDKLANKKTTTFDVTISYDSSVTAQPSTTKNQLTVDINYVQDVGQTITSEDVIIKNPNVVVKANGNYDIIGTDIQIGDEHFYVISSTDTTVTMLAKYNLDIPISSPTGYFIEYKGTGRQDSHVIGGYNTDTGDLGYGTIAFTDTSYTENRYWHDPSTNGTIPQFGGSYPAYVYDTESNLYPHVEKYKAYLKSLGVSIDEARLISKEELVSLGCSDTALTCKGAPSWVYATSYWTGTAYLQSGEYQFVWNVLFDPDYDSYYPDDNYFGIRPVITMSKANFD